MESGIIGWRHIQDLDSKLTIYCIEERFLSQGNFYIKQIFWYKILTTENLPEFLENKSYSEMMNKIQCYAR